FVSPVCLAAILLLSCTLSSSCLIFGSRVAMHRSLSDFFFQAEDGIRDRNVTGVQTCALPISRPQQVHKYGRQPRLGYPPQHHPRSEERRVGKSVDLGGRRGKKKKKIDNAGVREREREERRREVRGGGG